MTNHRQNFMCKLSDCCTEYVIVQFEENGKIPSPRSIRVNKDDRIHKEPAFCWWPPYDQRRRRKIISTAKSRIVRVSHKHGV